MGVDYAEYWIVVLPAENFQCPIDLSQCAPQGEWTCQLISTLSHGCPLRESTML